MTNSKILSAEKIMKEISSYVNEDVSYIDALSHYAAINDIEIELLGDIIRRSPTIKSLIRKDAERLKMVDKDNQPKLPI